METNTDAAAIAPANGSAAALDQPLLDGNGKDPGELRDLLHALQAMRVGDFSVRMPGHWVGIMGKVADTFNEIVAANQRMANQLERVGQVVGREGKTRQRVRFGLADGAWGEMEGSVNTLIDDLLWPTTEVTRAIAAVAQGDLLRDRAARRRRPAVAGRIPALGRDRQHHDQAAQRIHLGSDPRRPRSRHRGQARRAGPGARGVPACGRT